ncbi:M48 family metallopeptidase [Neptuniibacter sp. 1_MG-2023]|uniref:M48 family metallopeptidase n=1 Tax=Neptuniibacter sp. 1_MG-2023 TaxID=3062662 RepID=UPI0026E46139|nr:M48 family metallopeptidase [Neptuniibacter sp. 1_MG-2023]MDO6593349.1 M48 family metallopeptidase [Neptuniibacter sp. 1_MG-2023]
MSYGDSNSYQLPDSHDQQVKSFMRWLLLGIALFIGLVVAVIWFADRLLIHVPLSAEARFVKPYESLFEKYNTLDAEEQRVERYLQNIVDDLSAKSGFDEPVRINVHYLDTLEINAFATLGGNIFVLRGLVEAMPNENALAMVLAHEIAHVKHRDPIVSVSRGLALQVAYSFFAGDPGTVFNTGSELGMLVFSRGQEESADLAALDTLQRHYGHVAGATTFFTIMQEQYAAKDETEKLPTWLLSHPKLQHRIDTINARIDMKNWYKGQAVPEQVNL